MRALCPACGNHHDVVRVVEDGPRDVYQVAPLEAGCDPGWLTEEDLLEARARHGLDAIIEDDDEL
jgi:hypothetical protein